MPDLPKLHTRVTPGSTERTVDEREQRIRMTFHLLLNCHILENIKDFITYVGRTFQRALKEHEFVQFNSNKNKRTDGN